MPNDPTRVEIITGRERRRRYTANEKLALEDATMRPGMTASTVARQHGVLPSLLFKWRQLMSQGGQVAVKADEDVVAAGKLRRPGKKARLAVAVAASGRFPVKVVANTLGLARSNLLEPLASNAKRSGPYRRRGDDELLVVIRKLTDARPTYGYRRITALLNRARRDSAGEPFNRKRAFRLMAQAELLLQPHVGLRPVRAHEGHVIALTSNQRWSSDGLGISCWNGEVVHLAVAIDTCDREIIAWQASTGGAGGEMARDLMLACVERRFTALVHPILCSGSRITAPLIQREKPLRSLKPLALCLASQQCAARKATASAKPS